MHQQERFMQKALIEACRIDHNISPNPRVGCVIVKNDEIIAEGYHRGPGFDHAEVDALKKIDFNAEGADLYVTLEPCCHHGRTPPCVDAIIKAKMRRVFFSVIDPNPKVAGQGIKKLCDAGIQVFEGSCQKEAIEINKFFIHFMKHQKPYVIAKWAMSLDGKMMTHLEDSRQITSPESQRHLHQTRNRVDAILVGINTVIADNPSLTTRFIESIHAHHPCRIILDSEGKTPFDAKIIDGSLPGKTIIATTEKSALAWREKIKHAELWVLPSKNGCVSLTHLLETMAEFELMSVLVEGGRTVLESFFQEDLVSETQVYLSNTIIGNLPKKKYLAWCEEQTVGQDKFFRLVVE
jgi:diaminohydroxyphosphoribosylaminopyrimidine deaminase/5-amino-6-(5-phosphoribosylamino)uracil reductase